MHPKLLLRWRPRFPSFLLGIGSALLLVGGSPRATQASIVVALDLPRLVQVADHIAVVDVASVRTAWDERHERIYSTIELNVIENWKVGSGSSTPPDHLTIVQPGGTVGDVRMTVMGLSSFVPGERSLVFLQGPSSRAHLVGMTQGKRPMRYEGTSRNWMVAPPDLRQTKLVAPPQGLVRSTTPATTAKPNGLVLKTPAASVSPTPSAVRDLPLDDMRSEIKRLLGVPAP